MEEHTVRATAAWMQPRTGGIVESSANTFFNATASPISTTGVLTQTPKLSSSLMSSVLAGSLPGPERDSRTK